MRKFCVQMISASANLVSESSFLLAPPSCAENEEYMVARLFSSAKYDSLATEELDSALAAALLSEAETLLGRCPFKRPQTIKEIGTWRSEYDGRASVMCGRQRELFSLALADFFAARMLAWELPQLATAYRLTKDKRFLARTLMQLDEIADWRPIQRPGWQLCSPNADGAVEDGYNDGSWLATGELIRAISETLAILPSDDIPVRLSSRIANLMKAEIAVILEDWELRRGWFRSEGTEGIPATNQWVLPTEGLILASLLVGGGPGDPAYEFGVSNLIKALDVQGSEGEFNEGFAYSAFTARSFLSCAGTTSAVGDFRIKNHTFLKHYPQWFVHHFQPAQSLINAFDSGGGGQYERSAPLLRTYLSLMVSELQSGVAQWALSRFFSGPSADVYGLVASAASVAASVPSRFYFYGGLACRMNWVSSWEPEATGIWVRGGHESDAHDHQDRGHVSYTLQGVPLLIETGTPNYAHPRFASCFRSEKGHNVLQVDGCSAIKQPAPITVHELTDLGGSVCVDCSACYPEMSSWIRRVDWTAEQCSVHDTVAAARPHRLTFRWHLAVAEVSVEKIHESTKFCVTSGVFRIEFTSSESIVIECTEEEDATIAYVDGGETHHHVCVSVKTVLPVADWKLVTAISNNQNLS